MNFGHKIAIVYTLFVSLIVSMVILCIKNKDIFLVSTDYYKKEIAYQDEIDKHSNILSLSAPIEILKLDKQMRFIFPEELKDADGFIQFYRPSNANLDFTEKLNLKEVTTQIVGIDELAKGLWVVKIEFSKDGKSYLKEQKIVL